MLPNNKKYKQGYYKLKNPDKYQGDIYNVIYRSSWELKVFKWIDTNDSIISWSAEEIKIGYISPIDSKMHTYYPDILAKTRTKSGKIVTYLIEIKPEAQTKEPKTKQRVTKKYINEVYTWGINSAKWKAAKRYCEQRGWVFKLLTEKEIF